MLKFMLLLLAIAFCVARLFIEPGPFSVAGSYQALAHVFVGGLIGAALASDKNKGVYAGLAAGMSLVEVVVAVGSRL